MNDHYLTKRCHNNKHFSELTPRRSGKTAVLDMISRNNATVALCIAVKSVFMPLRTPPPKLVTREAALHPSVCVCCMSIAQQELSSS